MSAAWTRSAALRPWLAIWCGATAIDITRSPGRFIAIEGGEGAGKSTQVGLLAAALAQAGIRVRQTREPGGSAGGEAIRRLLLDGDGERWDAISEALLFVAARHDHVARLIAPALAQGVWVISDRFAASTLAYQGFGKGLSLDELTMLHRFALGDFTPHLTLILDLPVEIGLARAAARSGAADRFERLNRDFHEKLRQGFRQIAADNPGRCVMVDASGDLQTVHSVVLARVNECLGMALPPPSGGLSGSGESGKSV